MTAARPGAQASTGERTVRRGQTGLTLIEIMLAVAILAILAAVAYPLYTEQVRKSRRTEARVALQALAQTQERYFTLNGAYGTLAQLDDPVTERLADGNYAVAVDAGTTAFTITATARGTQAGDAACRTLSIDQRGALSSADVDGNDTAATCW